MTLTLGELTAGVPRLALVGLAKNTGKTVALNALLGELQEQGRRVGVTSVGRDGEERDAIDSRIAKPAIELPGESLVATTDVLLRASGLPHELIESTDVRTPLGRVLIARLRGPGAVEVAGPSAAQDVRAISDAMLAHGAEQVLIDGAIDRRAASSPDVADGLVVSTGAVLARDIDAVVSHTKNAVDLVRLPPVEQESQSLDLPPRFALTADAEQIAAMLDTHPDVRQLQARGALPDRFVRDLAHAARRRRRQLALVVADPTKVFLSTHGPERYRAQGIYLQAVKRTELSAITVNPVAPRSYSLDSAQLRRMLADAINDVPIFDVLHSDYPSAHAVPMR